jgi:hypothetical protein
LLDRREIMTRMNPCGFNSPTADNSCNSLYSLDLLHLTHGLAGIEFRPVLLVVFRVRDAIMRHFVVFVQPVNDLGSTLLLFVSDVLKRG